MTTPAIDNLINIGNQRKHAPKADGQWFIDWHNELCQLVKNRFGSFIAEQFNANRKDDGTLIERFDEAIARVQALCADPSVQAVTP